MKPYPSVLFRSLMLCHVMLFRCVLFGFVALCYVMFCCVVLCYIMLRSVLLSVMYEMHAYTIRGLSFARGHFAPLIFFTIAATLHSNIDPKS